MNRRIGAIFSYILMAFEMLSSFFFTPFLIRNLGDSEYGVYSLVLSISSYLALLDMGIGNSLIKYASKYYSKKDYDGLNNFSAISIVFYTIIGVVSFALGMIIVYFMPSFFNKGLTQQENQLAQRLLLFTIANISFTFLFTTFDKIILAEEHYAAQKIIAIFKIVFRVGLSTIALVIGMKSIAIVVINLLATIVMGIVSCVYSVFKLNLKPKIKKSNVGFIKEIVVYSAFIFIEMIATQINLMVDSILIGKIVASSTIMLAVYAIGAQINSYYQAFSNGINGILMPGIVSQVEKNDDPKIIEREMVKVGRIILMGLLMILICFIVEGKNFICIWVGDTKIDSYYVAVILMAAFTLYLTEASGNYFLWAKNQNKLSAIIKICVVLLNIISTVFLIKWNPLIGAALGTAISIVFGDVFGTSFVLWKKLRVNIFSYFKELFNGLWISFSLTAIFSYSIKYIISILITNAIIEFVLVCFAIVCFYVISLFVIGMNDYEKSILFKIIRKRVKK